MSHFLGTKLEEQWLKRDLRGVSWEPEGRGRMTLSRREPTPDPLLLLRSRGPACPRMEEAEAPADSSCDFPTWGQQGFRMKLLHRLGFRFQSSFLPTSTRSLRL